MSKRDYLAQRFEEHRTHLRTVAYRMLGSLSEVDDAVQEAWLRLSRADTAGIDNLGGWLTTVVARVCRHAPVAPIAAGGAVHSGRAGAGRDRCARGTARSMKRSSRIRSGSRCSSCSTG
jgi:hypothetical protein